MSLTTPPLVLGELGFSRIPTLAVREGSKVAPCGISWDEDTPNYHVRRSPGAAQHVDAQTRVQKGPVHPISPSTQPKRLPSRSLPGAE